MTAGDHNQRFWLRLEWVGAIGWWLFMAFPFLRPRRYVEAFDTVAYSGPSFEVTRRAVEAGHLPLWDSGIFGGVTHVGNPAAGALYPLKLLGLPFSASRGVGLLEALHLLILTTGLLWLTQRCLKFRSPASLFTTIAFTGSGIVMTKTVQFEQILVLAWLPWLCVGLHTIWFGRGQRRAAAAFGLVTAFTLLAGHAQIVYIELPLLAVITVVLGLRTGRWRPLGLAICGAVGGALLAAPQLLMAAQATTRAVVNSAGRNAGAADPQYSLPPARLLQVLLGNPGVGNPFAPSGSFESTSRLGVTLVLLALVGLALACHRNRWTGALLGLAGIVPVLLALGPNAIFHRAATHLIPSYSFARVPARWMIVPTFLAALAAGFAVHTLIERRENRSVLGSAVTMFVTIGLGATLASSQVPDHRALTIWLLLLIGAAAAALVSPRRLVGVLLTLLVVAEAGRMTLDSAARWSSTPRPVVASLGPIPRFLARHPGRSLAITNDSAPLDYLLNGLRPNANNLFGARSIDGYDGGVQVTEQWIAAMGTLAGGELNSAMPLRSQIGGPLDLERFARVGLRYLVLENRRDDVDALHQGWIGPILTDGSFELYENPLWIGEATLTSPDSSFRAMPVVSRRDGKMSVQTSGSGGMLRVDEQYTPEWQAKVDGRRVPTSIIDGFSVGALVPAGEHVVTFTYDPPLLKIGAAFSVVGFFLLVGLALRRGPVGDRSPASSDQTAAPSDLQACG